MTAMRGRSLRLAGAFAVLALAGAALIGGWYLSTRNLPEPETQPAPQPAVTAEGPRFTRIAFGDLPGWDDDDQSAALGAFQISCRIILRRPVAAPLDRGGRFGTVGHWRDVCGAAVDLPLDDAGAARAFFERHFNAWQVAKPDGDTNGLFTGYYEPELAGSLTPDARHDVPLYRLPEDLVVADLGAFDDALDGRRLVGRVADGRFAPYYDRAAIADGVLDGRGLELLWVDDPVDAFFLQIQGSGRVRLPDGRVLRVGYAGANGRPYRSIGKVLIDQGEMKPEEVSLQSLRAWLAAHPDRMVSILDQNPSYVFFRLLDDDGPLGAMGAVLSPGRSLAVDRSMLPLGAPVWLDASYPAGVGALSETPLRRLMIAQDTGGAIKGAVRGDVFWGPGDFAELVAGRMKERGSYAVLLPLAIDPSTVPAPETAAAGG